MKSVFVVVAAFATAQVTFGHSVEIVSPDGNVCAKFSAVDAQPKIAVDYGAKNIAVIDLGLVLEDPHQGGFAIEGSETDVVDAVWKSVWGDRAEIRDSHRDCSVLLRELGQRARRLRVDMRAYSEGFAFRYVILGEGKENVVDELTRVVFTPGTVAWPIYNTEDTYPSEPVDASKLLPAPGTQYLDHYMLPLTVRRHDGVFASLFEAYVRHYPRAKGESVGCGTKIRLIGDMEGRTRGVAEVELPFECPWRAIQIGKNAASLVENSTLVLNLNPPCEIKDASWIRPGLCLSDQSNCPLKNSDILAAAKRERESGIRHFQIDWGWYGTEWTWSEEEISTYGKNVPDADTKFPGWRSNVAADPRRPAKGYVPYRPDGFLHYGTTVDLDIPKLVKELSSIDVDLALYVHGHVLEAEKDLDKLFSLYRQWGVAGLKPGFVRYGDAESTDWNRMLVETAARHNLWLDIHDRHVPDGMQRTYPNLLLCEGGGGEEGNHPVRQDVLLPFARCLVGPFDYTPKLFRDDRTHCHSVAMLLVYPGPVAILRGSAVKREWGPELDFVRRLPMTYDDTKVPVADIGKTLVVARRNGGVWYVAGICGDEGYDSGFSLDFLERGGKWRAELCADGEKGCAVSSVRHVSSGDYFPVRMANAGGFTLILTQEKMEEESLLPSGKKFKLVWHDEFDGDKLDESKWSYRTNFWGQRAHWFAVPEDNAVEVKDGLLHLKLVKRADGQFVSPQLQTGEVVWDVPHRDETKGPAGFWPLPKREKPKFMHRYGYYECRCRLQQMPGWWTAFWMQTPMQGCSLDPRCAGIEHDIMESFEVGEVLPHCFHANGYGADYLGFRVPRKAEGVTDEEHCKATAVKVDKAGFHTFGMLWEPDGYTFYIDGKQRGPKVGGGAGEAVSQTDEFILVTTEAKWYRNDRMTGKGVPELSAAAGDEFLVDYVRVYDVVE